MLEEFDVETAEPIEYLIKNLGGKSYIIKEAKSGEAAQYKNAVTACSTINAETGIMTNKGLANTENFLISLCMYEASMGAGGEFVPSPKPVGIRFVESLPHKVAQKIFDKIREISNLNENRVVLDAIGKLFSRDDAPISHSKFNEWVKQAMKENKELRPLVMILDEERTKNSSSDTTAISE